MRDDETGSYWQQISGQAVSGPLRGKQLELVHCDELTFTIWKRENPNGTVLLPVNRFKDKYAAKDWDVKMAQARSVVDTKHTGLEPRRLIFGVEHKGAARAYPVERVQQEKLIQDQIGGDPVIVVRGPDGRSIRLFEASSDFYRKPEGDAMLMDSATGSHWNFQGCAIDGPSKRRCLKPVDGLRDYWFDWQL